MASRLIARIALLSLLAAGCSGGPEAPSFNGADVRVLNPTVWPGGEVRIASSAFHGLTTLPVISMGADTLAATRIDDTTLAIRLPIVSGNVAIAVSLGNDRRTGSLHIAGLLASSDTRPMRGWPRALSAGFPVVTVAGDSNVLLFNMTNGVAQALAPTHNSDCTTSIGYSFRASGVVTHGVPVPPNTAPICGRPKAWVLGNPAVLADSAPQTNGDRYWSELAPGVWVMAAHHDVFVMRPGLPNLTYHIEDNERLVVSPDQQKAILATFFSHGSVPVINAADGSQAFTLPLSDGSTVAWSPAGDTIFSIGQPTSASALRLLAFSGSTGAVLKQGSDSITDGDSGDLLPVGDYLVAAIFNIVAGSNPEIRVYDRRTFAAAGRVPLNSNLCPIGCQTLLAVNDNASRLYLLAVPAWRTPGVPGRVFEVEMPPAVQVPQILQP